jgi:hypothetical protein
MKWLRRLLSIDDTPRMPDSWRPERGTYYDQTGNCEDRCVVLGRKRQVAIVRPQLINDLRKRVNER